MNNEKKHNTSEHLLNRRAFLGNSAIAAAAFTIVPRHVLGGPGVVPPSDKLNLGCVGVGGKGRGDIRSVSTENIVALCDVDDVQMAKTLKASKTYTEEQNATANAGTTMQDPLAKANKYRDFREMLEKEKDLDGVTISTPDHTHAVIAMAAMKMGKHVFCQKPLTHSVAEARLLAKTAKESGLITQMGNQGHAGEGARLINEWIWDGAIGDVREVHAWTNRPIWPQGIKRPSEIPSVPSTLDWNLWQGPAKFRPYHPAYCPFSWRGWWDYGTGAIGDMGAHILDHPFWALKLKYADTVVASSTRFNEDSFPLASKIHYEFPARGEMPPVKLHWYDGGLMPDRPEDLEEGRRMGQKDGGVIFVGDKGKIMCSVYGRNPRIFPETKMRAYTRPAKTIPRSPGIHEEWVAAIKSGTQSTTNFQYASELTEMMLIGNIAVRLQDKNTRLKWDGPNMRFTNLEEANNYLQREYRPGWSLE